MCDFMCTQLFKVRVNPFTKSGSGHKKRKMSVVDQKVVFESLKKKKMHQRWALNKHQTEASN